MSDATREAAPDAAPGGGVPMVSIGLPVYNGERFLHQAIDSILEQTLGDFELIISDNASTDATASICQAYAARDARIRYFRQRSNMGAPRNWNFVLRHARAPYFKWASANDFCDARLLQVCIELLERDKPAVACFGRTCLIDDHGRPLGLYSGDIEIADPRPSERFRTICRRLRMNNLLGGVIRTRALRRLGPMHAYPAGDLPLVAGLALAGTIRMCNGAIFYRRIGEASFSAQLTQEELQYFLDPSAGSVHRFAALKRHRDHVRAILSAPITLTEKLASLAAALRHASWDAMRHARRAGSGSQRGGMA
ncbi:MAG: glycosyltransferase family 2 protein [Zoogloea sp.]|nr:glycosyltransferase family 2 protein [Zoogloea sp.]